MQCRGLLCIVSGQRHAILQEASRRRRDGSLLGLGLLGHPVAPGAVGFRRIARAQGDADGRACGGLGPPAQRAPLADQLGVEHFRSHRSPGSVPVLQHVEPAGIAGPQDDGTIVPAVQAMDLAVIEPGDLAVFPGGLVHFEQLTFHACADEDLAVFAEQAENQSLFAEDLSYRAVGRNTVQRILTTRGP